MSNNKIEIESLFRLSEEEKKKLCMETVAPETNVCVCDSFIAFLDSAGQLIIRGSSSIKQQTSSWNNVIRIRSGNDHLLGLTAEGRVLSAGNNDYGQCNTHSWKNIRDIFADRYFSVAVTDADVLFFAGRIDRSDHNDEKMEKLVSARISEYDLLNQDRLSKSANRFSTMTEELKEDVRRLSASLKNELKEELKNELKNELKTELLGELRSTVSAAASTGAASASASAVNAHASAPVSAQVRSASRTASDTAGAGSVKYPSPVNHTVKEEKTKKRCYKCMRIFVGDKYCPKCGYNTASNALFPALKTGTSLLKGKYTAGAELYRSSDGIRYVGFDEEKSKKIVIYEFLPQILCTRAIGYQTLTPLKGMERKYTNLRENFLNYYNTLSVLGNQINSVRIRTVFSENNTVYAVEDYAEGRTLREYLSSSAGNKSRTNFGMSWQEVCRWLRPLALDLYKIHNTGHIGHYAVSPGNIIISKDNDISLTSFSIESLRHAGGLIEPSLLRGFSAPEQYNKHMRLNEATDVYGFAATVYFALTKIVPEESTKKNDKNGIMIPPAVLNQIPSNAVKLINSGLSTAQGARLSNFNVVASLLI